MKVRQVMSTAPVTVDPGTTVRHALKLLAAHAITTLPVVDPAGRILGVVGEGDLLAADRQVDLVRQVMRRTSLVVGPETEVIEASQLLRSARIRSLPVVDAADQVVGMVSRSDVVRTVARGDDLLQQDILDALSAAGLRGWRVTVRNGIVDLGAPADVTADCGRARRTAEETIGVDEVRIS